ncbi:pilus assembly protein [Marichromatium bheemlicum]|uniref:VWFA domain-containing protein n=1 Tax=Marichromatium bheemlicum TaxID=365339 RepID=A0ABX1I7V7_9GAMM|nr:PilC/PilY family type IV pilus protein [Marichromatium bheemlicum]NKN33652.1 hypothetical protein [Marichromatium bheemlicum]
MRPPTHGPRLPLIVLTCTLALGANSVQAAIASYPLFLALSAHANILVVLDNSNSMDETPNGSAIGSDSPQSKSEIAREVIRHLITNYTDAVNMGLMAYQQSSTSAWYLHNSPYDVSYYWGNYDDAFDGPRDSTTKRFRIANPTDPGNFIYYNVALPFYAGSNTGNAFCYNADAGFPTLPSGGNNRYTCYRSKTGHSVAADDPDTLSTSGYSDRFFDSVLDPTDSDLAQGISSFGKRLAWSYVGRTWYANTSPGRGYLHVPIDKLDRTHADTLKAKLACNIPNASSPCSSSGIRNAGLTPIEGTLLTAHDYFAGRWNNSSEGYTSSVYPLPESCGRDFVILVSDGLPSTAADGTNLSDPAAAIAEAAAAAEALLDIGIKTYVVGFALPYGAAPETLDTIAESGGTNQAYRATDAGSLTEALETIFAAAAESATAATIATNSTRLNTGTLIFQAKFDTTDWTGRLLAYKVAEDGTITDSDQDGILEDEALWSTTESGKIPGPSSRAIYSLIAGERVALKWSSLNNTQQETLVSFGLGENMLAWVRGEDIFRERSTPLGDIINSNPLYVGRMNFGYEQVTCGDPDPETGSDTYTPFRIAADARTKMLYVGANDGMLHAFEAETGIERFAVVPESLLPRLNALSDPSYTHRYLMDGSPQAADVCIDGSWRRVLVASTGAGGRTLLALDITDPDTFTEADILWEYTGAELGYPINQFIQPTIGRLASGDWVIVAGNGYESDGERAQLLVIDIADGTLLANIDTGVGDSTNPNGLAGPVLLADETRLITTAYAGDQQGNLWKFDLSASNAKGWAVAFKQGKPLFRATGPSGTPQPITSPPEIAEHPNGGLMILFGTGQYHEVGDNATLDVQSLYGIWDHGPSDLDRDDLLEQRILAEPARNGLTWRVVSNNEPDWTSNNPDQGWRLDLLPPTNTALGERVVSGLLLRHGRAIFTTLVPSDRPCDAGGTSWLMELDLLTGGRLDESVFDVNGDEHFDQHDEVAASNAFAITEATVAVSGRGSEVGITDTPSVISAGEIEYKHAGGSTGDLAVIREKGDLFSGRQSWRQLR